jgi:hypothetical protein
MTGPFGSRDGRIGPPRGTRLPTRRTLVHFLFTVNTPPQVRRKFLDEASVFHDHSSSQKIVDQGAAQPFGLSISLGK